MISWILNVRQNILNPADEIVVNTAKALNHGLMCSLIKVTRSEIKDFSLLERAKNVNRISRKKTAWRFAWTTNAV